MGGWFSDGIWQICSTQCRIWHIYLHEKSMHQSCSNRWISVQISITTRYVESETFTRWWRVFFSLFHFPSPRAAWAVREWMATETPLIWVGEGKVWAGGETSSQPRVWVLCDSHWSYHLWNVCRSLYSILTSFYLLYRIFKSPPPPQAKIGQ